MTIGTKGAGQLKRNDHGEGEAKGEAVTRVVKGQGGSREAGEMLVSM